MIVNEDHTRCAALCAIHVDDNNDYDLLNTFFISLYHSLAPTYLMHCEHYAHKESLIFVQTKNLSTSSVPAIQKQILHFSFIHLFGLYAHTVRAFIVLLC